MKNTSVIAASWGLTKRLSRKVVTKTTSGTSSLAAKLNSIAVESSDAPVINTGLPVLDAWAEGMKSAAANMGVES